MKFGYTIIYTDDVAESISFFERAFGLRRRFVHESGYGELETGETTLSFASHELGKGNLPDGYIRVDEAKPVGVEIALVTEDVQGAYGFFKEAGFSVNARVMTSIPSQVAEAATNAVDVSGIALAPGLFASVQRNINLRLVGDKQSLRPGFSSTRLIARADLFGADEAATMRNLRGRKIAGPGRTSIGYYLVAALFRKHGMGLDDMEYVELPLPDMAAAMASGAVDGALLIDPFLSRAVQGGIGRVVSDLVEFVPPGGSIAPLIYSEKFGAERDVAVRFMTAYMRGVRVYNDAMGKGVDRDKVIEIVAKGANVPVAVVANGFPTGLDPDQKLDKDFIAKVQSFYVEQKLVEKAADIDRMVDTSFADAAREQLGVYK
jgi:NitT/TauT family transport system substrate-binding protein